MSLAMLQSSCVNNSVTVHLVERVFKGLHTSAAVWSSVAVETLMDFDLHITRRHTMNSTIAIQHIE